MILLEGYLGWYLSRDPNKNIEAIHYVKCLIRLGCVVLDEAELYQQAPQR